MTLSSVHAQQTSLEKTSIGSEFKFVFLQNRILSEGHANKPNLSLDAQTKMAANHGDITLWITVANQEASQVDVEFSINEVSGTIEFAPVAGTISQVNSGTPNEYWTLPLAANTTTTVEVIVDSDNDYNAIRNAQMMYNLLKQRKMITVRSNTQIADGNGTRDALLTVYAESRQALSRDAAMILPTQSLGSEYIAITGNKLYDPDNFPVDEYNSGTNNNHGGPSEIAILAVEDITVSVTIPSHVEDWNSSVSRDLLGSAMDFTETSSNARQHLFHLEAGEAIQLQSDFYDLTGTQISARKWFGALAGDYSKPVTFEPGLCAVFSGNMAAHIGYTNGVKKAAWDHVYEQMYPIETYGCEYLAVHTQVDAFFLAGTPSPMSASSQLDVFKIIAGYDGTIISTLDFGNTSSGGTSLGSNILLNKGEYIVISKDRAYMPDGSDVLDENGNSVLTSISYETNPGNYDFHFRVKANLGITVAQFMVSSKNVEVTLGFNPPAYYDNQDPSMVLLSPIDQTLTELDFVSMPKDDNNGAKKTDYILIFAQGNRANLELDGSAVDGAHIDYSGSYYSPTGVLNNYSWKPIPGTSWHYIFRNITNAGSSTTPEYHTLKYNSSASGTKGFLAYVYGTDFLESYFYAAGINAEIRRVFPGQTLDCLEPNDPSNLHDADYLNSLGLLKAEGGLTYQWDIVFSPQGSGLSSINDILVDNSVAEPVFKTGLEFTEVGTYAFECTISKDGTCDFKLNVEIVVPSCCVEREESEDYLQPVEFVNESTNWSDRVFIDDNRTIVVGPGAVLKINNADVVFGQCAKIEVKPGGVIEATNSVFRSCNQTAPWSGIFFKYDSEVGSSNRSQFNECTFKNAVSALNIENGESVGIHNNLFLNNYTGIDVLGIPEEGQLRSSYVKQITGNKFVLDNNVFSTGLSCTVDHGQQVQSLLHFGIKAEKVIFSEPISHNEFNNTVEDISEREFIGGMFVNCKLSVTESSFSEMLHGLELDHTESRVVGNQFNCTATSMIKAQIDVRNALVKTEIQSNEFTCWGNSLNERAIYVSNCDQVTVLSNVINGFEIGILSVDNFNTLISQNKITDAIRYGIYADGVSFIDGEKSPEVNEATPALTISCNEIDLDRNLYDLPNVGIGAMDLDQNSQIISNCILDCMVSIYLSATNDPNYVINKAPKVRNNFLYNYDWVGIYMSDFTNSSGSYFARHIQNNTHYSNSHAFDIFVSPLSSPNSYVYNTFGLSKISSNITVTGGSNEIFSTASCGRQIYRNGLPIPGNPADLVDLSESYNKSSFKCDANWSELFSRLGSESTAEDVISYLSLIELLQVDELAGLPGGLSEGELWTLLSYANHFGLNDKAQMLMSLLEDSKFDESSRTQFKFQIAFESGKYHEAKSYLEKGLKFPELKDWRSLSLIELSMAQEKRHALSPTERLKLEKISENLSPAGSKATAMLNLANCNAKLKYPETPELDLAKLNPATSLDMRTNSIRVFPNPAANKIEIQVALSTSSVKEMTVIDIYGKEINSGKANYTSGTTAIDISDWESGVYFVNITLANGQTKTAKFVKL